MNFERLASRIKSTADSAVTAAKAFKGLDAMAAQDEYIHSADLNVARRKDKNGSASVGSSQSDSALEIGPPAPESSSLPTAITQKLPPRLAVSDNGTSPPHLFNSSRNCIELSTTSHSMLPEPTDRSVPVPSKLEVYVANSTEHPSAFSDNERCSGQETTPKSPSPFSSTSEHNGERRRNTNRFMEDLDAHISKPMQQLPPEMVEPLTTQESDSSAWRWGRFLGKDVSAKHASAPTPLLARPRREEEQSQLLKEESYHNVMASTMLAEEEMAQLQALKMSSTELPSWRHRLWVLIREHPREAFVALTLVLGIWVFFYTRASAEDVA